MNYNPSAKRILVFGDSLSWGYQPGSNHERFASDVRWPGKLQVQLGTDFEIIEENLNSRGIVSGDPRPGKQGRKALDYIEPCMDSHDPLDMVIVLLGTNEMKHAMNQSAEDIGRSMETLLDIIRTRPSQFNRKSPDVILVSPPIVNEETQYCRNGDKYLGATKKSHELQVVYETIAQRLVLKFVALDSITAGSDGVHIDADEHAKVANLIYGAIND